jgi:hypothetical protein
LDSTKQERHVTIALCDLSLNDKRCRILVNLWQGTVFDGCLYALAV